MITTLKEALDKGRSPLNIGRSTERNKRRQARSLENLNYRRSLNSEKANARSMGDADVVQRKIDEIRNRS